jgi:hypothetical protein
LVESRFDLSHEYIRRVTQLAAVLYENSRYLARILCLSSYGGHRAGIEMQADAVGQVLTAIRTQTRRVVEKVLGDLTESKVDRAG